MSWSSNKWDYLQLWLGSQRQIQREQKGLCATRQMDVGEAVVWWGDKGQTVYISLASPPGLPTEHSEVHGIECSGLKKKTRLAWGKPKFVAFHADTHHANPGHWCQYQEPLLQDPKQTTNHTKLLVRVFQFAEFLACLLFISVQHHRRKHISSTHDGLTFADGHHAYQKGPEFSAAETRVSSFEGIRERSVCGFLANAHWSSVWN